MLLSLSKSAIFLALAVLHEANAQTSTVTVSAPASSSSSYTSNTGFRNDTLTTHNLFRYQRNATSLSWNNSLATIADKWSASCFWGHSHGPTGENLAAGFQNVTAAVTAWGDEQKHYSYQKPGFSEQTGHFSQVVWKATTSVGCGRKYCGTSTTPGWYVVCEYWPPGNVIGDFAANVSPEIFGLDGKNQSSKSDGGEKEKPEGSFGPMRSNDGKIKASLRWWDWHVALWILFVI
jgi:hypothetical protein